MTLESIKDKINEVGRLLDGNHVADAFVILENIAQEEQNYKATDNLKKASPDLWLYGALPYRRSRR